MICAFSCGIQSPCVTMSRKECVCDLRNSCFYNTAYLIVSCVCRGAAWPPDGDWLAHSHDGSVLTSDVSPSKARQVGR